MTMPLFPHRTMLANLQETNTLVALELIDRLEMGLIVEMTFDAANPEQDEITLSRDTGVLLADATVHWGEVTRVWTPIWTPTAEHDVVIPIQRNQRPAL